MTRAQELANYRAARADGRTDGERAVDSVVASMLKLHPPIDYPSLFKNLREVYGHQLADLEELAGKTGARPALARDLRTMARELSALASEIGDDCGRYDSTGKPHPEIGVRPEGGAMLTGGGA